MSEAPTRIIPMIKLCIIFEGTSIEHVTVNTDGYAHHQLRHLSFPNDSHEYLVTQGTDDEGRQDGSKAQALVSYAKEYIQPVLILRAFY